MDPLYMLIIQKSFYKIQYENKMRENLLNYGANSNNKAFIEVSTKYEYLVSRTSLVL